MNDIAAALAQACGFAPAGFARRARRPCVGAEAAALRRSVVLMVVQPGERNAIDQRWLEYTLFNT